MGKFTIRYCFECYKKLLSVNPIRVGFNDGTDTKDTLKLCSNCKDKIIKMLIKKDNASPGK